MKIRNFSIIAHIDHGKSTLADRILELTQAVNPRKFKDQMLDDLMVERERGITIKARAVTLTYQGYRLNLIDTPGHVDFSYEVSRALEACEGALLVVDATQGVQAQTIANAYLAVASDLVIIPVINKIDLPQSNPAWVKEQLSHLLGIPGEEALEISAKTGEGVPELLQAIIQRIPPPSDTHHRPLRALIFDAWYDAFRGVQLLVRVADGRIQKHQTLCFMAGGGSFEVDRLGIFTPEPKEVETLSAGEVGYVSGGIKNLEQAQIGDTLTSLTQPAKEPLPGFKKIKPMVFAGIYPVSPEDYPDLKKALAKYHLNDSAFSYQGETSQALGFGFRCGFLGMLHLEVVQERLEKEFGLNLITTAPSVPYEVTLANGEVLTITNPHELPPSQYIQMIKEPYYEVTLITPDDYLGPLLDLCEKRRGKQKKLEYIGSRQVMLVYHLPLAEILMDFYDKLKTLSRGYATMDYTFLGFFPAQVVKLTLLINQEPLDALSIIVHKDMAYTRGKTLVQKLKAVIPRQLFEVVIQAAMGARVIARERIPPLKKNVLAKCYGGDVTRKRKLLEKQKEGKKRMKRVGKVEIPQEAFLSVLRVE